MRATTFAFLLLAACGGFKSVSSESPSPGGGAAGDEAGADDDAGTPSDDAAAPQGDASSSRSDAGLEPEAGGGCATPCSGRTCGKDPVCGVSCGNCSGDQACDESASGAACKPATIVWEVDGVVVVTHATFEAVYTTSQDSYGLFFPYWGRSIQIGLPPHPTAGTLSSCPSGGPATLGLITSDNSYAGLDALPARWKNLVFTSCGAQSSGDAVTARDLTITTVSPARVAGSYEFVVQGAAERAGSTLRVRGVFDVAPTAQ